MKKSLPVLAICFFVLHSLTVSGQAPTIQATSLTFTATTTTSTTVSWVNGNGNKRAVFVKAALTGSPLPVDNTFYTANPVFGSGSQIGSSGWYCVCNGTGTSVTITGLTAGTSYSVKTIEYTQLALVFYLNADASGNPATVTTAAPPAISYASPQTYSTGTAITSLTPTNSGGAVPATIYGQVSSVGSGFDSPYGVAVDAAGNLYVAGFNYTSIKKIAASNGVVTDMGSGLSGPDGVAVDILSNRYWDVNAGVYYSANFPDNNLGFSIGAAVYHAGTPREGAFSNSAYHIDRRISLQGGLVFILTNKDEINLSSISEMQGENSIFTLGGVYKARINSTVIESLHIGVWNRFRDAIYPYIALEGKNWLAGISYDVINSQIRDSYSSVQSMEFSLAWHFGSVKK